MGRKTYESLPNRTLPNRKIFVVTSNKNYVLSDKENHFIFNEKILTEQEKFFVAGGSSIYKMFLESKNFPAKYVLDFVCDKKPEIKPEDTITKLDIHIEIIKSNYNLIETKTYEDNIKLNKYILKGEIDNEPC
jgi:hypothetical protein